jgi:phospholipid/cholesterol/gamma-HCH transport system permease protein
VSETIADTSDGAIFQRAPYSLIDMVDHVGGVALLAVGTLKASFHGRLNVRSLLEQVESIGLGSLFVATLTAVFSSMVMEVQFAVQLARFGATDYVVSVVSLSMLRELGPVLTAILVGGRLGSGIAAELGSMRVTEQLEAMQSMGADLLTELVAPRVLASILVMPLLTGFAEALGIAGAMAIARLTSSISMPFFFHAMLRSLTLSDLLGGLAKTVFFAALASLIACHEGLSTLGGTEGVGRAATRTVVSASIATLICDFVLTNILLAFHL